MRAWGSLLLSILAKSIRGSEMSSANRVWPVHLARASTFRRGFPITLVDRAAFSGITSAVTIDASFRQCGFCASDSCRCHFNGLVYFDVPRAPAEIAGKSFLDLVPAWI